MDEYTAGEKALSKCLNSKRMKSGDWKAMSQEFSSDIVEWLREDYGWWRKVKREALIVSLVFTALALYAKLATGADAQHPGELLRVSLCAQPVASSAS